MKKKKTLRSLTAVTWLLVFSIMGTWLISMVVLTVVTAQEIYDAIYEQTQDFATDASQFGLIHEFYNDDYIRYGYQYERPDYLENRMLYTIGHNTNSHTSLVYYHTGGHYDRYDPSTGEERQKLIRSDAFPLETAILIYSPDGELLHSSKNDAMYFGYYTQEEWDAGMDSSSPPHYGWMDITEGKNAENREDDPFLHFRTEYDTHGLWHIPAMRVTGYLEGTRLIPVVLHYITETQVWDVLENTDQFSTGPDSHRYTISAMDRTGLLDWQLQFDRSDEHAGADLVTMYIERPDMWNYVENPLTYQGEKYESLAHLTEELDLCLTGSFYYSDYGVFKLNDLLIFSKWVGTSYGREYATTGKTTTDFYLIAAVRSNPLLCAVSALRNLYIVTGLLALVLLLIVRGRIRRSLIAPIAETATAMERHWGELHQHGNPPPMWWEAAVVDAGFDHAQDMRRMKDNEINRLKAALEYANTAEQNRRQMTSNIAHELKTPLAVIHSYAEGLKEHIAEDKRDKYLDVILTEAERTDAMVLEMLDLSRLEAGKVKLARDEFSLSDLTRAIFEKLELAVQAKELNISFALPDPCTVTADEGRIAQVIGNFATNAVKYTPAGGAVWVRVKRTTSSLTFAVENESPPLSEEALAKVWDTFYRTDESRSGGGTGLGLAIAKNVITLHGGKCSVRNTKTGVEFSFTIPTV